MLTNFFCPYCRQPLQVDSLYAGQEITCPACHRSVIVPGMASEGNSLSAEYQSQMPTDQSDPLEGLSYAKVQFNELLANTFKLIGRYFGQFFFIGFVFAVMTFGLNFFLGRMGMGATMLVSSPSQGISSMLVTVLGALLLMIAPFVLHIIFTNYIIHLLRTGDSDITHCMPKKSWAFVGSFLGSLFFALKVIAYWLVLVLPLIIFGVGIAIFTPLKEACPPTVTLLITIVACIVLVVSMGFTIYLAIKRILANSFFIPFIIDRNVGVMRSFDCSVRFSKGNLMAIFGAYFVLFFPIGMLMGVITGAISFITLQQNGELITPEHIIQMNQMNTFFTQTISQFIFAPLGMSLLINYYFLMTNQPSIFKSGRGNLG